ncbi:MAG: hypothetical protein AAF298_09125 [Cyanobacteria bacterium P01_A01_bin.40]
MSNSIFSNLELEHLSHEDKGILHQHNNCFLDFVCEEDNSWALERLYIHDSIFKVIDGVNFEDIKDAIEDGEELIDYLCDNQDKFQKGQEFILVWIDPSPNFIIFKDYLEKRKSNYQNHLGWKIIKTK